MTQDQWEIEFASLPSLDALQLSLKINEFAAGLRKAGGRVEYLAHLTALARAGHLLWEMASHDIRGAGLRS